MISSNESHINDKGKDFQDSHILQVESQEEIVVSDSESGYQSDITPSPKKRKYSELSKVELFLHLCDFFIRRKKMNDVYNANNDLMSSLSYNCDDMKMNQLFMDPTTIHQPSYYDLNEFSFNISPIENELHLNPFQSSSTSSSVEDGNQNYSKFINSSESLFNYSSKNKTNDEQSNWSYFGENDSNNSQKTYSSNHQQLTSIPNNEVKESLINLMGEQQIKKEEYHSNLPINPRKRRRISNGETTISKLYNPKQIHNMNNRQFYNQQYLTNSSSIQQTSNEANEELLKLIQNYLNSGASLTEAMAPDDRHCREDNCVCYKVISETWGQLILHIDSIHLRPNMKSNSCPLCPKVLGARSNMLHHIYVHTKEKPYECDVCKKCFGDYSILNKHQRIHNNYKPHQCQFCGKTFAQSGNRGRHENSCQRMMNRKSSSKRVVQQMLQSLNKTEQNFS
ncbi:hypothetical protein SNEBB_005223 [Seison nebaliae]|nr:hypothetical protein SNEBB_005223 [Seison nebaliae]